MRNKDENICRVCLNVVTNEFMEIDEVMWQMFNIFLLKLDLNIIRDPIICWDCAEIAKNCLRFKLSCLSAERIIILLSTEGGIVKHDIQGIYKNSGCVETAVGVDSDICRICMVQLEGNNSISLNTLRNETPMFEIISGYLPEMDVNIIKNPMICTTCRVNLECYVNFVINCLNTEGKIKAFSKEVGTDAMEHVNLNNVLHFLFKEFSEKYSQICASKEESNMVKHTMYVYPERDNGFMKVEELEIKEEIDLKENSYKNLPEMGLHKYTLLPKEFDKDTKSDSIRLKTRENKSKDCSNQKEVVENDMESSSNQEDALEMSKSKSLDMQINQRIMCTDQRKHVGKHVSQRKRQSVLEKYKKNHKESSQYIQISNISSKLYKCAWCTYESKDRSCIRRHMLVHKDIYEIKMHKCSKCTFETKHKGNLKSHMLRHKHVSEIKMHKCLLCVFEAKEKSSLKRHMLRHKDASEIEMHKCSMCTFETKHKGSLKSHMLTHKDVSELKMYKCLLCVYESKEKSDLKRHMLIHKDVSEIKMHKCSMCTFETKHRGSFKSHIFTHKDVSEINMHKCLLCVYGCKEKKGLKRHMLTHKDASQIEMHKCSMCTFETKYKDSLKSHVLTHKDVSEIKMRK